VDGANSSKGFIVFKALFRKLSIMVPCDRLRWPDSYLASVIRCTISHH